MTRVGVPGSGGAGVGVGVPVGGVGVGGAGGTTFGVAGGGNGVDDAVAVGEGVGFTNILGPCVGVFASQNGGCKFTARVTIPAHRPTTAAAFVITCHKGDSVALDAFGVSVRLNFIASR